MIMRCFSKLRTIMTPRSNLQTPIIDLTNDREATIGRDPYCLAVQIPLTDDLPVVNPF